jgi:flagellar basal body-associated protein FliL
MPEASSDKPAEVLEEKPVQRKSSKKAILATALIAFLLGGGAGGYVALTKLRPATPVAGAEEDAKKETTHSIEGHDGANIIQVNRITLTLEMTGSGASRSLLVTPIIVVHPKKDAAIEDKHGSSDDVFSEMVPELRDNFIEYLSQLEPRDLTGSAGMSMLRAELKRRADAILENYDVDKVLFNDFVIQ